MGTRGLEMLPVARFPQQRVARSPPSSDVSGFSQTLVPPERRSRGPGHGGHCDHSFGKTLHNFFTLYFLHLRATCLWGTWERAGGCFRVATAWWPWMSSVPGPVGWVDGVRLGTGASSVGRLIQCSSLTEGLPAEPGGGGGRHRAEPSCTPSAALRDPSGGPGACPQLLTRGSGDNECVFLEAVKFVLICHAPVVGRNGPQEITTSSSLQSVNVTSFGKKGFCRPMELKIS